MLCAQRVIVIIITAHMRMGQQAIILEMLNGA